MGPQKALGLRNCLTHAHCPCPVFTPALELGTAVTGGRGPECCGPASVPASLTLRGTPGANLGPHFEIQGHLVRLHFLSQ